MPPVTRSRRSLASADPAASAAAQAAEEERLSAASAAAESKRQKAQQASEKRNERARLFTELQFKPDVTADELAAAIEDKPQSFWAYENWWDALKHYLATGNYAAFTWYLNEVYFKGAQKKPPPITTVLNMIYDADPKLTFSNNQHLKRFFADLKAKCAVRSVTYDHWLKHVAYAENDDAYMLALVKNGWDVLLKNVVGVAHERPRELISEFAKYAYDNAEGLPYAMIFSNYDNFAYINEPASNNKRALLLELLKTRPIPIVAKDDPTETSINLFLARCLRDEASNADMLEAFSAKFSMREPYNSNWMTDLFRYVIAPSTGHPVNAKKKQEFRDIVKYVLRRYKLDVNKLFVQLYPGEQERALARATADDADIPYKMLAQLFPGDQDRALGRATVGDAENQYKWLGMYMPLVAFAVMNNKDAVVFVQSLGGKLLPEMRSLATDPEVVRMFALQEFVRTNRATKIQRAYKERMYAPDHPSQTRRAADWNARLGGAAGAGARKAASGAAVRRKK